MFSQSHLDGRPKVEKPRPAPAGPSNWMRGIRGQPTNPMFGAPQHDRQQCQKKGYRNLMTPESWHPTMGVEDDFLFQLGDF